MCTVQLRWPGRCSRAATPRANAAPTPPAPPRPGPSGEPRLRCVSRGEPIDDSTARSAAGVRVRRAREAAGVSLRSLAASIGVSPATLSQIENGRTGLRVDRLEAIAAALGVGVTQIIEGTVPRRGATGAPDAAVVHGDWRQYGPLDFSPILLAAVEEFLAVGYHGTTMRRISTRCGMSVPGIYNYYPSKQLILVDILDRTMADLEWRAAAAAASEDDAVGKFCALVENLALYHTHRRRLGFLGSSEVRALEPSNQRNVSRRRNRQQALVDEQVHAAGALGHFRPPHPDDAARAVVTMCTALPTWWQPDGRLTPEQLAAEYVDYALGIMRYQPPTS
ncbi:TetR family transcriptional regulator [Gordonia terrae]|uniref:TetR family transcriptional regulator n=1 Tax=Gordonia terrae TaxID=2055 RepID=A0A2I1R614_9ACTN|nr:TetR family transcriptional regulator [Gordonia terrae]